MSENFTTQAKEYYPSQVQHFDELIKTDRLSHLYLLVGPGQPEQLAFSRYLAWQVLGASERNAKRIDLGDHPDLQVIQSQKPGATIKISQIRSLTQAFTTTALEADRKVFIIDQAQLLTNAAANALLKFIEEPAGPQLILMLAPNLTEILPTIRSRAQIVHMQPVGERQDLSASTDWTPEWEQTAKEAVIYWFKLALANNLSAFALVATRLTDLFQAPGQQQLALNWVQQLIRDVLVYQQLADDQLYFAQLSDFYQKVHERLDRRQLLAASQVILAADQLRNVNLSFQARFEKLTLELGQEVGQ